MSRDSFARYYKEIVSQKPFDTNDLFDPKFPQQKNFVEDPAKLKALWCTRRASKSYVAGLYMVKECLDNPGVNCLFIGLTRLSAEGIIWKDILKVINRTHKLGATFNGTTLTMTFPNGSMIWVTGVDADEDEMNKLLGKKYRLVCLDESSLYTINLTRLVYGILKPAVADPNKDGERGTICMMGTSSNFTQGLFFEITNRREPGWSLHTWTALDNPFIRDQWQEELDDIKANRPMFMETPLFKQWYLNQWDIDTEKLVYKFNQDKNLFDKRPLNVKVDAWSFVLGVDLGYEDDSAFVLCAFHENDPVLYIVSTYNKKHMDITDVANKIKEYQRLYSIGKVIVDGADKQSVEEMRRRHGVPLEAAEKQGKSDFIELLNAELIQAKIKINNKCTNLINEMMGLVWKTTGDTIDIPRKEHPSLPNHLCDAMLYAWRYCYSYMAEAVVKRPVMGTKAWQDEENVKIWEKEREKLQEEYNLNKFGDDSY
jgi:phage terminase large subunit